MCAYLRGACGSRCHVGSGHRFGVSILALDTVVGAGSVKVIDPKGLRDGPIDIEFGRCLRIDTSMELI